MLPSGYQYCSNNQNNPCWNLAFQIAIMFYSACACRHLFDPRYLLISEENHIASIALMTRGYFQTLASHLLVLQQARPDSTHVVCLKANPVCTSK